MPLKQYIKEYSDFPSKGVLFRDITPLLEAHFIHMLDALYESLPPETWAKADAIAGIEARGFTLAAGIAAKLNKNIIQIRKAGKLPGNPAQISYELEYGKATLEMHHGAGNVIIIDDVLATGGTLQAAAELCTQTGRQVIDLLVLIDLVSLNDFRWNNNKATSVLQYE